MISKNYALKIGQILVDIGGANSSILLEPSDFIYYLTKESGLEYRFMGHLGSGGKFRITHEAWKVDCYSEDFDPKKKALIVEINKQLKVLYNEWLSEQNK